jgi:hypothetical protein
VGLISVIEVGRVVGNFVGEIDKLGFERRSIIEKVIR